jgi:SAM-dependent methyltransferase
MLAEPFDVLAQPPHRVYSKSSAHYLSANKDYFLSNDGLLDEALAQNRQYAAQPRRSQCKVCASPLGPQPDFAQHGVEYGFCPSCGHLNGLHEDTQAFVEALYIEGEGTDYGRQLLDANFTRRADSVYSPKAEFLLANLPDRQVEVLDVGCGGGHFVYALLEAGVKASGIDVGRSVVEFGNAQISHHRNQRPLSLVDEESFFEAMVQTSADVVSAIGVIEHLREPARFFDAFRNSRARYLYYSVPMFSMSVILEGAFAGVFPRQLSGGHTHLFTESSIAEMNRRLGARAVAEWRFGTDVMDLYRSLSSVLQKAGASARLLEQLEQGLGKVIDPLQQVLDGHHFCSEIHLLAERR